LLEGDVSPSGDARLDGVIVAVDQLRSAVLDVQGDFAADMRALANIYGLPEGEPTPQSVAQLTTAIQADIAAHTQSFRVLREPAACYSNIEVAARPLAQCEVNGGCDVPPAAGRPAVQCQGTCLGSCAGTCSGSLSCAVTVASGSCDGVCDGTCASDFGLNCDGVCRGECSGACTMFDGNGRCIGTCDGECLGSCDGAAPAACPGSCSGRCLVEQGSVQCSAKAECGGQCSSLCEGECVGRATPRSSAPSCAATQGCEPQAAAQGSASAWCTPPVLDMQFVMIDVLPPEVQGAFFARTAVLERRATAILQGAAKLGVLITGSSEGVVLFDPAPIATVTTAIQQVQGLVEGLGIPAGRLPCVAPALQAAVSALVDTGLSAQATLEAQTLFATGLLNGV
jgi:hypothetical protein